jgi:hypothetical protein
VRDEVRIVNRNNLDKDKMGGVISTYEGGERCIDGLGGENLKERNHSEVPGVIGRIILRWIFRKKDGGMDWIELAQDRDRWRALVNVVMNLRVP